MKRQRSREKDIEKGYLSVSVPVATSQIGRTEHTWYCLGEYAKDFFIWSFGKSLQISRTTMSPSHSRKGSSLRFAVSSVIMKLSSISSLAQVFSRLLNLYRHCWNKYEEYLTVFFAHILPRMNCSSANLRQLRLSRKFQVVTVARQHRLHAWLSPGRRPR